MSALVRRPTEDAAVNGLKRPVLPPADLVADALIVARATDDRYGARHFSNLLDRILEGAR
ncbi:hypothetical protein [Streptomyces phaeoluteigriseus]|uniref:hypothetical protein n=1 Tax=Streptomyces phaeoluteigriseus TaxID=114686 RepID=UPI00369DC2D2